MYSYVFIFIIVLLFGIEINSSLQHRCVFNGNVIIDIPQILISLWMSYVNYRRNPAISMLTFINGLVHLIRMFYIKINIDTKKIPFIIITTILVLALPYFGMFGYIASAILTAVLMIYSYHDLNCEMKSEVHDLPAILIGVSLLYLGYIGEDMVALHNGVSQLLYHGLVRVIF